VTEEAQQPAVPTARVATRPGPSGVAERRRRIYQRHLLVLLAVFIALIAADQATSPGVQWAFYPIVPWLLIFVLHTVGLLGRGYSIIELLLPPRRLPVKDVYTTPLDYELVRSRQLHDGITKIADAVRPKDAELADGAVAAAKALLDAMESLVEHARSQTYRADDQAKKLVAPAQDAVAALDGVHRGLLKVQMLEEPVDQVPVEAVNEQASAVRHLVS
jgi:hypothetical protein